MNFNRKPLKQYKYLTFLTMLFITVFIICDTTAFRMVDFFGVSIPLSGLIIPFLLAIADVIAEVYGYHITMKIIFSAIVCQLLYGILITIVLMAPSPLGNTHNAYYNYTFEHIIRTNITSCFSVTSCMFTNAFLISKLKIYMHGKRFWFRSILAGGFSELVLCIVAYIILFAGLKKVSEIITIIYSVWIYRIILTMPMAPLCTVTGAWLKKIERSDVYDIGITYNPFKNINHYHETDSDFISKNKKAVNDQVLIIDRGELHSLDVLHDSE